MNYEFSHPLKINELFKPILQLVLLNKKINYENLINAIADIIMISYNSVDTDKSLSINIDNIILQVELSLDEALEYLVSNNIISINKSSKNEVFKLTDIGKLHIQSEEPIKFYDLNRNLRYILDFLP